MNTKEIITQRLGSAAMSIKRDICGQMENHDPKFEESGDHVMFLCMVDCITDMLTELAIIIKEENEK